MRFDTADGAFRQEAMEWLQSLTDEAITDLQEVFRISPGYYPTTLVELWKSEVNRRNVEYAPSPLARNNGSARLPVCHPGDYEWRFTAEAAAVLLDQATMELSRNALVAHLGTPTTFVIGHERHPLLRHTLLERNSSVIAALHGLECIYLVDLTEAQPPVLQAHAAILDPPWYPGDTHAFLVATSTVCAVGARIVLCQPTLATRPGVAEERAILLDELPRLGFACREVEAARVRYHMPHFEASSLKIAAPDLIVPDDWRVGDMLILEKVSNALSVLREVVLSESWQEVAFGPVRIKLRRTEAPDLGSLVPDDILDTVSRRDPIRKRIGLWTSGNRVFSLESVEAIGKLIELCHTDIMQSMFTFKRLIAHARTTGVSRRVAHKLFDLLLVELQEHTVRKEA
ncbi:MAG: hypothetical protein ACRDTE_22995 [Pseudonocardiaceae bacterium]